MRAWWSKLKAFLTGRQHLAAELREEMDAHLEFEVQEKVAAGLPPEEARVAGRRNFGNRTLIAEKTSETWGFGWLDSFLQDLRYALRTLRKNPGFTSAVVLSLALGIGANTAIFSLIDAVMWRMLPVKDARDLWLLSKGSTFQQFRGMRDQNGFADLAAYAPVRVNVSVDGSLEPTAEGQLVSGTYFSLLGVIPVAGRAISRDDDRFPNRDPVAVISYNYWKRRFGLALSTVGRTISLSGKPFTIIGVTPPEFFGIEVGTTPDIFVPLMMQPTVMPASENLLEDPISYWTFLRILVRLKPSVYPQQAAEALWAPYLQATPETVRSGRFAVQKPVLTPAATGLSDLRRQFSQPLFILMAAVGVILLIACVNTANLLLARAAARAPEFVMRLALGAGRGRLVRQLLVESISVAVLGGLGGILLARWATRLLAIYMSEGRAPITLDLNPDLRTLALTTIISIATGVVFGLAPAMRAARIDLAPRLRGLGARLRPGKILAILQVALSLLLLITAGLFTRSLQNLNRQDSGFARESVLIARVEPRGSDQRHVPGTSQRLDRTYRDLLQRVETIPGVHSASLAGVTPTTGVDLPAELTLASGDRVRGSQLMVYPHYFETLGMAIVAGRDFGDADLFEHSALVCVVNETFARRAYPRENPIGKPCLIDPWRQADGRWTSQPWEIVGVVKSSKYANLRGDPQPAVYTTFFQTASGRGQMVLSVRAAGDAKLLLSRIRQEVWAVDKTLPQFEVHTLAEEVDAALIQDRLIATLASLFGILALVLASVGLYGLVAFSVVQRTSEMGIRMALGAVRSDVLWMVQREAMLLVLAGVAIGVPAAIVAGRIVSSRLPSLLFELKATDPATIVTAAIMLILAAVVAAYIPARRASRVDPMVALRNE